MIDLIVCVDKRGAIGYENKLILKYKSDMSLFQRVTYGRNIIMGRLTAESIPVFPLKKRTNLILSNSEESYKGCKTFKNLESIMEYVKGDAVVIGGSKVYDLFLKKGLIDRVYLTQIQVEVTKADTYFNSFDIIENQFEMVSNEIEYDDYMKPTKINFYEYIKK